MYAIRVCPDLWVGLLARGRPGAPGMRAARNRPTMLPCPTDIASAVSVFSNA